MSHPMTSDPNLLYTDVEDSLRSTVGDLLAARCPADAVTAVYDGDRSVVALLWRSVAADLGLAGLLVPETAGGAGASAREAAVVLEELGRAAAPVPFLTSSVVATAALGAVSAHMERNDTGSAGSAAVPVHVHGDDRLLAALAAGERTAALAVPLSVTWWGFAATATASGDTVSGTVTSVAGALDADVLLVPVAVDRGVEVRAVEVSDASVEPVVSLDMGRQVADVSFDGAPSRLVVSAEEGGAAIYQALLTGAGLLASEQLGVAQWCLEATVAYLNERRQFGRVVGGFQALKHRLADMYVQVEQARAAARYAAATLADGDPDAEVAAAVAQAYCSDVAVTVAEECVQLHGGIGMTWEHPAHLYLKRAKADQIAFGTPSEHRARLATLVDVPA